MTLGNMRALGVQRLIASCLNDACRHVGLIDVSKYPGDAEVPWFARKVVCNKCGARGRHNISKCRGAYDKSSTTYATEFAISRHQKVNKTWRSQNKHKFGKRILGCVKGNCSGPGDDSCGSSPRD